MRPRWNKVISDLTGNPSKSLLVIISIAVGLFALGMILTTHSIVSEDMRIGYEQINPPNIQMQVTGVDDDVIQRIRKMESVRYIEGIRQFGLRTQNIDGEWTRIDLTARKSFENVDISKIKLINGSIDLSPGEILIDQYKFKDLEVFPGLKIKLELPSSVEKEVKLRGIIQDQTIGATRTGGGFFTAPAQGYILWDDLPNLEQEKIYNQLLIVLQPDLKDLRKMRSSADQIAEVIKKNNGIVINTFVRASDSHPNAIYANAISAILFVLGFLVVFLSTFLITNTLTALMNQQIQQVGIMKSVGATRRQIVVIYMVLIFLYGLIAFLIALPLSNAAGYRMVMFLSDKANYTFLGKRTLWSPLIILLLIALVIPQIAGFFPIRHGSKIKVSKALQAANSAIIPNQKNAFFSWITGSRNISRPLKISLRNTFRQKKRLILTLLTLSLGGAIFIATFNVQIALTQYIDQVAQYFLADVNLDFERPYRISKVQEDLIPISDIAQVEGWSYAPSEIIFENGQIGDTVQLIGPPIDTVLLKAIIIQGRWLLPEDQNTVVLNEVFKANFPDLSIGDSLNLRVAGEDTEWTIVGFFKLVGKSAGYIAYTDYQSLAVINNSPNHTSVFRIASKENNMSTESQKKLAAKISERMRDRGYKVLRAEAGKSMLETTTDGLNIITFFLLIMALLSGLVGSIGLMGTMSLNVMDRTREIGVMRAIGASDYSVFRLVVIEGGIIGIISWLLSLILAIPITKILSDSISNALFDAPGLFAFTFKGVLLWFFVVLFFSITASILPAWKAVRLTIREVLAYE